MRGYKSQTKKNPVQGLAADDRAFLTTFNSNTTGSNNSKQAGLISAKHIGKELRMLSVFADGRSLNRFEAAQLADSVLNTTVSDLRSRYGVTFARKSELIINRFGTGTRVTRYWLEGEQLDKAKALTAGLHTNASDR